MLGVGPGDQKNILTSFSSTHSRATKSVAYENARDHANATRGRPDRRPGVLGVRIPCLAHCDLFDH